MFVRKVTYMQDLKTLIVYNLHILDADSLSKIKKKYSLKLYNTVFNATGFFSTLRDKTIIFNLVEDISKSLDDNYFIDVRFFPEKDHFNVLINISDPREEMFLL